MPITFIDIERQKNWRIAFLFLFLILLYFLISVAFLQGIAFIFPMLFFRGDTFFIISNSKYLFSLFAFSLLTATIHFYFSAHGAVKSVMKSLDASPPDPEDSIHQRLRNIIEEIHVATGDKRRIQCMVIPSLSMNALAVIDLNGESAIGITEGLLSRLTRPQLEAIIAHEAYHILSGDCMEATVAASLFGIHASILEKMQNIGNDGERGGFYHPAFLLFWVLLKFSHLLNMFISREREYRADAGAVRMTRNPKALAEALYLLSKNWRGTGFIGRGLEMLCIVNPAATCRDESEGWLSDMLSTHPPLMKRIGILLNMARVSISELKAAEHARVFVPENHGAVSGKGLLTEFICPVCKKQLYSAPYEKTKVYECKECGGILVKNNKLPRIIARREKECTERIKSLAKAVVMDNQKKLSIKKLRGAEAKINQPTYCPKCNRLMFRKFYSLAYLVEIDACGLCNFTWFDVDELEMLQCLIENKITPYVSPLYS